MSGGRLLFDRFEFDLGSGELREGGAVVRLRHQSSRALALLLSRPGEVVGREELRAHLWGNDTFVDFDQGLNQCVKEIRAALGDSASTPRFVETLPRRGYRWVAPLLPASLPPLAAPAPPLAILHGRRSLLAAAALALALALAGLSLPRGELRASETRWQRLTFQRGRISAARLLPEGGVALSAAWDGGPLQLQALGARLDLDTSRPIDLLVGIAPGGEAVTLFAGALERIGPRGSVELARQVLAADLLPGGREVAAALADEDPRGARLEWPLGHQLGRTNRPTHLRVSPDGRRLAVIDHPLPDDDSGRLVVFDPEGGRRTLGGAWSSLQGVAWTPDGSQIWVTGSRSGADNALHAVDAATGDVRALLSGAGRLGIHDIGRDGRVLLERSTSRVHLMFGRPGAADRDLTHQDGSYPVELSADGGLLLFGEGGEAGGASHSAWIRTTDGGTPVRLANGRPVGFTRDGTAALVIPGLPADHVEVVSLATGTARRVAAEGVGSYLWAGSHPLDPGGLLLAGSSPGHGPRLYEVPAGSGTPVPITPEHVVAWRNACSPDGRYFAARCGPGKTCLYPLADGPPVSVSVVGAPIRWDSSGRRLLMFQRRLGARAAVVAVDPWTGQREDVIEVGPADRVGVVRVADAVITADGRAWAYSFLRRTSELFVAEGLPVPGVTR